jgi:hypothetical protein
VSRRLLAGDNPRQTVKPIKTGIPLVDKMAIMEVTWYTRQLHRIGSGKAPRPHEAALKVFVISIWDTFTGMRKTRRLRAS